MVIRETVDGVQFGLQIGGRMVTNLRYTDGIILLSTSEAELQELVDRLDRVSRKYDTRCYFNVRSKADMNRLNLPHGDDN